MKNDVPQVPASVSQDRPDTIAYTPPPCPDCGANDWKYVIISSHSTLHRMLIDLQFALIGVAVVLAIGSALVGNVTGQAKFGYLCLGALLVVLPAIFFLGWLVQHIHAHIITCQSCNFTSDIGSHADSIMDA